MLASSNRGVLCQQQAINQEAGMMPTSTLTARPTSRASRAIARTPNAGDPVHTAGGAAGRAVLDPLRMDLPTLVRRSLAESERFYRGQPHDTRFSYELFRRALVEHDDFAWAHIYAHYSPLVESWARRSGAFASSGESSEFFVGAAFIKFWRAITERFEQFPTLASLLSYLQLCAGSVVIDSVRAQSWAEMLPEEAIPFGHAPQLSPDEEAMKRVTCEEFWSYVDTQLNSEAERVVVFRSFVLGMRPGDIFNDYQHLFQSVNDVYNVKRNVLGRLSRNPELRKMLAS
jgi:DNA-directed RNA polymerase specialized sigma24 family protein